MTFEIKWSENALKQLRKLDMHVARRIVIAIDKLKENPYSHVKKLVGSDAFRLRIGDYRIILDIKNNELEILIITSSLYTHG